MNKTIIINIIIFFIIINLVNSYIPEILINNTQTTSSGWTIGTGGGNYYMPAQSFNISSNAEIPYVEWEVTFLGDPTAYYCAEIQTDNSGEPSGSLVDSCSKACINSLEFIGNNWYKFNFSCLSNLTAETTYWFVITHNETLSGSHYLFPSDDGATNSFAWGNLAWYDGSIWTNYPTYDLGFRIYDVQNITCTNDTDCEVCQKCNGGICDYQNTTEDLKNECETNNICFNQYTMEGKTGYCDGLGTCGLNGIFTNVSNGNVCINGSNIAPTNETNCGISQNCITNQTLAEEYYIGYVGDGTTNCSDANWTASGNFYDYGKRIILTEHKPQCLIDIGEWKQYGLWNNRTCYDGTDFTKIGGATRYFDFSEGGAKQIFPQPTISNGYVYIAGYNGEIKQLSASNISQLISYYSTGKWIEASPVVVGGYLYIGDGNGNFFQLNATDLSQVIATYYTGDRIYTTVAVMGGYIYLFSKTGYLYQLNANNISIEIKRQNFSDGTLHEASAPTINNGYIYLASRNGLLYQIDLNNISNIINTFNANPDNAGYGSDFLWQSPIISNGYLYIGSMNNQMYQLDANNISVKIANYTVVGWGEGGAYHGIIGSPALSGGYIYIGDATGIIYQLDANNVSKLIANFTTGRVIWQAPAIAYEYVYVGSSDGQIYQLNATNITRKIANFTTGDEVDSTPAIANGYVYIPSYDGKIYQLNAYNISQNLDFIPTNCTPNWACDTYSACNSSNIMPCNSMADLNFCGTNFTGNISDYNTNCTYPTSPFNGTSQDLTSATIDTGVKLLVGFKAIAILFGITIAGIGITYAFKKLIIKKT